jgi:hypothetical protein
VIEAVGIEHDVGAEVRRTDARVVLEDLFGPLAQAAVGLAVHKPRDYNTLSPCVRGSPNYATLWTGAQAAASAMHDRMARMSDLLDRAIQVLRTMPENMQDAAAQTILNYAASLDDEQAHA